MAININVYSTAEWRLEVVLLRIFARRWLSFIRRV